MKKYLLAFGLMFAAVSGCSESPATINGSTYVLTNGTMPITLGFDENGDRYFGKAVNNYFGPYKTDGDQITFGAGGATMMMGDPAQMEAERAYLIDLSNVATYKAAGNTLTLTLKDGKELKFEKQK